MHIAPPIFPLTATAFGAALRAGHGRAMQQVVQHGARGLEDKLIDACIACLSFDPQCEAERAPWLFSIADRAKLNEKVVQALEATAGNELENYRDLDQRSAILKELAAAGSDDARRLLYATLARLTETGDVIGDRHIVALDGEAGLLHVARQLGRWLQADPDFWVSEGLIAQCDDVTGTEGAMPALERAAVVDPDIAAYVAAIRKPHASGSSPTVRPDTMAYSGARIVAYVKTDPKEACHWFRQWGAHADNDACETVFAALLASDEPEHVKRLLRCFAKNGVPRFDARLLQWLAHPDEQVRWNAVKALAPVMHGEVRSAAKQLIADGDLARGIALLVNNFEAGDFAMCAGHLALPDDADEAHTLVGELVDLCAAHPGGDALDCLLYVYEHSPCSTCRREAVKVLIGMDSAPAWVLAESGVDADPETRALARLRRSVT